MKILIAEDENDIALIYKQTLEDRDHHVTITPNGEDCLKTYHDAFQEMTLHNLNTMRHLRLPFDVVLLDYKMPQINGLEVAKEDTCGKFTSKNNICLCVHKRNVTISNQRTETGSGGNSKTIYGRLFS